MTPEKTEQQTTNPWLKKAETVARDVLAAHTSDVDSHGRWPAESIAALGSSGLLGLTVPTSLGGAGEGPQTFAAVTGILAEHCASTAMIYLMHVCGIQVIAASSSPLRETVLRSAAAAKHLSTLAFSEKGSRSNFWAPVSQAVAHGDTHRLSAEKSFVTSAGHADSYVVSTRAAGIKDPIALTLYLIPPDAPGLTIGGRWNGLGLRGNASSPMRLEGIQVPATYRLSGEGEGFAMMMSAALPWFQVGSAAVSVGIGRAAVEATRRHLLGTSLEHLGQPLAALPNLRARLAQMQISLDTQQAFLEATARRMANPDSTPLLALLECKAAAGEAALQITDLAMRACGGAAFSRHLGVERHFRDARAGAVMAPTTDVLYDFIGRLLLGMPLF
jgi:alkylation response protein AidB-like acyl-CoA dehydrogenase